jgi:hypothetical protein
MLVRRNWKTTALFVPALLLAGASAMAQAPQATNPAAAMTPVTDAVLRDPPAALEVAGSVGATVLAVPEIAVRRMALTAGSASCR